ncbi:MAG: ABC transporter permease subunit [Planctomycetota bacterium]|nr:ABC transporter permease subunit [Planctomycetota bacterium]
MSAGGPLSGVLNLGMVERALRETWKTTLALAVLVGAVCGLLSRALPAVQERFMQRSFVPPQLQELRNTMLGIDSAASTLTEIAYSLAWSHPLMLVILFAHAIILCTRVPAGEIDKGTIDVLFGLPVSRFALLMSETLAWLISAGVLLGAVLLGSYIGSQWVKPEYRPDWGTMSLVLAHLSLVYGVIGSVALLAAACNDRRGRAVLIVLVAAVASLVLNFLEILWEPARNIAFLSVLHYYRPAIILREDAMQWKDFAILGGICLASWITTAIVLARRSLSST